MVPATSTPAMVVGVPKSPVAALPVTATVDAEPYRCEVSVSTPADSATLTFAPAVDSAVAPLILLWISAASAAALA